MCIHMLLKDEDSVAWISLNWSELGLISEHHLWTYIFIYLRLNIFIRWSLILWFLIICWQYGRGDHGRLGCGRKVTTGHPMVVPIDLPPPKNCLSTSERWCAKFVACGGRHTLAIATWIDEPERSLSSWRLLANRCPVLRVYPNTPNFRT